MLENFSPALFWLASLLQVAGLASVVIARLTEGCRGQLCFQRVFYLCLLAVGVASMLTVEFGSRYWLSFGITLAIMAVGATLELGRSAEVTAI